jgi:hypothetical protein
MLECTYVALILAITVEIMPLFASTWPDSGYGSREKLTVAWMLIWSLEGILLTLQNTLANKVLKAYFELLKTVSYSEAKRARAQMSARMSD